MESTLISFSVSKRVKLCFSPSSIVSMRCRVAETLIPNKSRSSDLGWSGGHHMRLTEKFSVLSRKFSWVLIKIRRFTLMLRSEQVSVRFPTSNLCNLPQSVVLYFQMNLKILKFTFSHPSIEEMIETVLGIYTK